MLKGKKTYLFTAAAVIVAGVHTVFPGVIPEEIYQVVMAFLVGGGVMALRAGVSKCGG